MIKVINNKSTMLSLIFVVISTWSYMALAQPKLESKSQAIRNGNIYPTNLQLTPKQRKAIGWLSTGLDGLFCTATVISENTIITAKHCFYGDKAPPIDSDFYFSIAADQNPADQEGNLVNTGLESDQDFWFDQSNIKTFGNIDIALVTFRDGSEPFNRSDLTPIPINIYPIEGAFRQNLSGSLVDVAGYGETLHINEKGRYFASVKVELVTATYIITYGQNEQGVCLGDSGGPLLAAGVDGEASILAVVTSGDRCCVGYDQLTRVDLEANNIVNIGNAYTSSSREIARSCWGIYRRYSCRGNTLQFCSEGKAMQVDCTTRNQSCGYDQNDQRFDCINVTESACPGVPPQGLCIHQNTAVKRCEYGRERIIECESASCQTIGDGERVGCVGFDEYAQLECNESNSSRLEWASEAKFTATSNCQQSPKIDLLSLSLLIFLLSLSFNRQTIVETKSYVLSKSKGDLAGD